MQGKRRNFLSACHWRFLFGRIVAPTRRCWLPDDNGGSHMVPWHGSGILNVAPTHKVRYKMREAEKIDWHS